MSKEEKTIQPGHYWAVFENYGGEKHFEIVKCVFENEYEVADDDEDPRYNWYRFTENAPIPSWYFKLYVKKGQTWPEPIKMPEEQNGQ